MARTSNAVSVRIQKCKWGGRLLNSTVKTSRPRAGSPLQGPRLDRGPPRAAEQPCRGLVRQHFFLAHGKIYYCYHINYLTGLFSVLMTWAIATVDSYFNFFSLLLVVVGIFVRQLIRQQHFLVSAGPSASVSLASLIAAPAPGSISWLASSSLALSSSFCKAA